MNAPRAVARYLIVCAASSRVNARKGLLSRVNADGRLGCVPQTGAEAQFYKPTAGYNYGIGPQF